MFPCLAIVDPSLHAHLCFFPPGAEASAKQRELEGGKKNKEKHL